VGYTRIQGAWENVGHRVGPLDHAPDSEGGGPAVGPAAPDIMADVLEGTLGRDRWRRFLHDGSLYMARPGHVLHGVRHRPGLPSRADPRIHAAPRGAVHAADRADSDDGGGRCGARVHILICDRDRKWSGDVRRQLWDAGTRVVFTPERAPNANAYAERFVRRSTKNAWTG